MLKTWITGTKDFTDQGLAPSEWINDNVTIVDGGKLGKCMSFNGSTSRLSITGYELGNKWSFACWVKDDSSVTAWQMVLGLNNNGSDADIQMGLWLKSNENRLEHSYNGTYNSNIPYTPNQWNHFVGTYDGSSAKFYINGELKATNSHSGNLSRANLTIGARCTNANGAHTSIANPFKGLINDVRIWDDHCLSPMEVKKLSQGLVLHYPLSRGGWGQENIFKKTREVFDNNGARLSSTTINNGLIIDSTAPNGKYRSWNVAPENGVNRGFYYTYTNSNITLNDLVANEIYTLSFWVRCSKTKNLIISSLAESQTVQKVDGGDIPSSGNIVVDNKWQRHSVTFKWISTSKITTCFYLRSLDENVTLDIASPKLEKGSIATPWCPNSSDTLYTTLGYNDNIEYDTSGFGNNGTRTGTFSWTSDTPKYSVSQSFNGTDNVITLPSISNILQNSFTMNVWFRKNELGSKNYETLFGGLSGFEMDTRAGEASTLTLYMPSPRGGTSYTSFQFGEWYMVTLVNDGTNELYYINGELVKTIEKKAMPNGTYFIGAWNSITSQNYKGLMSDFRIYVTALSAEDIQKLYSVSALIDSQGNTFASSYVEG